MTSETEHAEAGLTFLGEIDRAIDRSGADRVWAYFDDRPFTLGELRDNVRAVAGALAGLGVAPGDRVGLYGLNSPEWLDFWLAAPAAGARAVPINVAFRGEFLTQQLREPRVSVLFVDAPLLGPVLEVAGELPDLRVLVVRGEVDSSTAPAGVSVVGAGTLYDRAVTVPDDGRALRWNDPYCIFYTSGTTGPSKGAVVTQHYLLSGAGAVARASRLDDRDVVFGSMPLFHFGGSVGLVLMSLVAGAQIVIDSAFSVGAFWERISRYRVSVFAGVGPMVMMVWSLPPGASEQVDSLRLILAAPVPRELHGAIEERYRVRVRGAYGMTEIFPLCVQPFDQPATPGAAGRANPSFDLRLVDEHDREVPPGAVGEIVARPRAPHVMFEGYDGRPAETLAQLRNLWFHTGDLARLTEDGELTFVDRKKDAIRRRGENISSFEVEAVLMRHPDVGECAAHAVPSELGEDEVKICVVRAPGSALTAEELAAYCEAELPRFMVPRYIEFLDALPKTMTGRVRKVELRARPIGPETWERP